MKEGVTKTGGVGILLGNHQGSEIALRLIWMGFRLWKELKSSGLYRPLLPLNNKATGVMHACGHHTHVAILMVLLKY